MRKFLTLLSVAIEVKIILNVAYIISSGLLKP